MITTECVTYSTWCERSPSHGVDYIEGVTYPAYLCSWAVTIMSKSKLA